MKLRLGLLRAITGVWVVGALGWLAADAYAIAFGHCGVGACVYPSEMRIAARHTGPTHATLQIFNPHSYPVTIMPEASCGCLGIAVRQRTLDPFTGELCQVVVEGSDFPTFPVDRQIRFRSLSACGLEEVVVPVVVRASKP